MHRRKCLVVLIPLAGAIAGATDVVLFGMCVEFNGIESYAWWGTALSGAAVGLFVVPLYHSTHVTVVILRRAVVGAVIGCLMLPCVFWFVYLPLAKCSGWNISSQGVTPGGGDAYAPLIFILLNIVGSLAGLILGPLVPMAWRRFQKRRRMQSSDHEKTT